MIQTGRYNYMMKKMGAKEGYFDIVLKGNEIEGMMYFKKLLVPVFGKADGQRIELHGSIIAVGIYVFSITGYEKNGVINGKFEDKRGAAEFSAIFDPNFNVSRENETGGVK